MTFFRSLLLLCPAVCLLAQAPTPKPPAAKAPVAEAPAAKSDAPAPKPTVTLSVEDPNEKKMPAVPPDRVVLTVGEQKITAAEFDHIIDALPVQYRSVARGSGRKQFADNLARILVLAQEGKRLKLDQTPAYKSEVEFQSANILAGQTYSKLTDDLKVDDAELQKYYDEHKSEFEQVHARHILIRMKGSPLPVKPNEKDLTEEEALAKAQELRKQILSGADFAKLAETESDDSGSASKGGDLGFFHHGQMVPSFEEAAFKLNVGEVSEPVKSPFGYHLIQVEAKQTKTLAEVRSELEQRLKPEMAQKELDGMEKQLGVTLDPEFFNLAKK
ncbi:MAG TPA: peptidylprolyl isomerase [Bryobacteraceae bacterium]|nr:peptidylprolyl isomerase [Bryobacteraceae bacterium]